MPTSAMTIRQLPTQWKAYASAMNTRQKMALGSAALATLITLVIFVRIMQTPEMKTLYTGMDAAEAQRVAAQLEAKKIVHEVAADGTVKVAADQLDNARLEFAATGLPQSGRLGFELFDKPNWAGSEFSEHVNYQRALEGELEHTIATISQVESARVHLVLAHESLFEEREKPAKAAVVLKLSSNRLESTTVSAIQNLVASAVEGLRPEDVTVVGADNRETLSKRSGREGLEDEMELAIGRKVSATLEPVVGEGKVRTSVTIEQDTASVDNTEELYDGKNAVPLAMQRSEQRSGAPLSGGVPGTASNLPSKSANTFTFSEKEQTTKAENGTYGVNRTLRHSIQPAGRIRRMTVAVLLDEPQEQKLENGQPVQVHRQRSKNEMDRLAQLARAAAGFDASRGDVLEIESMRFEADEALGAPSNLSLIQRLLRNMASWAGVMRYIGISLLFLAVYGFVLRPLRREAVSGLRLAKARLEVSESKQPVTSEVVAAVISDAPEKRVPLKRRVLETIEQRPDIAGKLLSNWLKQGGSDV